MKEEAENKRLAAAEKEEEMGFLPKPMNEVKQAPISVSPFTKG